MACWRNLQLLGLSRIQRIIIPVHCNARCIMQRPFHTSPPAFQQKEINPDEPIKFTTSRAHSLSSMDSFDNPRSKQQPPYQPFIVVGSFAIFLIYFCILREENDLDEQIGSSLFDKVPGLEASQIKVAIQYGREKGQDVSALVARQKELQELKENDAKTS